MWWVPICQDIRMLHLIAPRFMMRAEGGRVGRRSFCFVGLVSAAADVDGLQLPAFATLPHGALRWVQRRTDPRYTLFASGAPVKADNSFLQNKFLSLPTLMHPLE